MLSSHQRLGAPGLGRKPASRSVVPVFISRRAPKPCMAVEAGAVDKTQQKRLKKLEKRKLYLLHWQGAPSMLHMAEGQQEKLTELRDQLKMLEKVSKDAVWFRTVEGAEGEGAAGAPVSTPHHVLMVTGDKKAAKKYKLQELVGEEVTVPLGSVGPEGAPVPVTIPVGKLRAAMIKEESDSDSDDEGDAKSSVTPGAQQQQQQQQQQEEAASAAPPGHEEGEVVEDPLAREHARALLGRMMGSLQQQAQPKLEEFAAAEQLPGLPPPVLSGTITEPASDDGHKHRHKHCHKHHKEHDRQEEPVHAGKEHDHAHAHGDDVGSDEEGSSSSSSSSESDEEVEVVQGAVQSEAASNDGAQQQQQQK